MTFVRLLAVTAAIAMAGPASAHSLLKSSEPAANATVAAPENLTLTFGESVGLDFATVTMTEEGGETIELGEIAPGEDGRTLLVPVPSPLAPGSYTVNWSVLSKDGHPVNGDYGFTVGN